MNAESYIPRQQEGLAKEVHHVTQAGSEAEAALIFERAKNRLLDVTGWASVADGSSARFLLFDQQGKMLRRMAQQGDLVRIELPAPRRASASGYDWVRLDTVKEGRDEQGPWIVLTTRPAPDPTAEKPDTAHFFSDDATGTFVIRQRGNRVEGKHYGRNEQPNTNDGNLLDKARALMVTTGAYLGLSDMQWSNLVKGLISEDPI
jgi:hypothetical protein